MGSVEVGLEVGANKFAGEIENEMFGEGGLVEHRQDGALAHPVKCFADVYSENCEGGFPFLI